MDMLTVGVLNETVKPQAIRETALAAIQATRVRSRMGRPRRQRGPGCGRQASSDRQLRNSSSPIQM